MKRQLVVVLFLLAFFVGASYGQIEKKSIYGVLLDNTGTMRTQLTTVKNIGMEIIEQKNATGEISVFNFATKENNKQATAEMAIGVDWNQDKKFLEKYIDNLSTVRGLTNLFDAIRLSGETLNLRANSGKDKISEKILILLTDGEDRDSQAKPKELIKFLSDNGIKVFAVAFVEEVYNKGKSKKFLKKLTEETSGNIIFPSEKQSIKDIVKSLFTENIKNSK